MQWSGPHSPMLILLEKIPLGQLAKSQHTKIVEYFHILCMSSHWTETKFYNFGLPTQSATSNISIQTL